MAGKTQVFLISLLGTLRILLNECPLGLVYKEEEQEKIEKVRLKLMSQNRRLEVFTGIGTGVALWVETLSIRHVSTD